MSSYKSAKKRRHKDGLTVYLQRYALQLKNKPCTLKRVARVFQKMMKTLYDTYLPNAEARRPRRKPDCPEVSDILRVGWLLEYIGEDSSGQHRNYSSSVKRSTPLLEVPT